MRSSLYISQNVGWARSFSCPPFFLQVLYQSGNSQIIKYPFQKCLGKDLSGFENLTGLDMGILIFASYLSSPNIQRADLPVIPWHYVINSVTRDCPYIIPVCRGNPLWLPVSHFLIWINPIQWPNAINLRADLRADTQVCPYEIPRIYYL